MLPTSFAIEGRPERRRMLHRRNLRYGQGRRVGKSELRSAEWIATDCRSRSARTRRTITKCVWCSYDFYIIEAKPDNLIADRAYDSDPLDAELRKNGIEMIAPHRSNRSKPPTQDRRRLSRYMRRWLVERFFAWIQWQRRILVRWEYYAQNFSGSYSSLASLSSSDDFEIGS